MRRAVLLVLFLGACGARSPESIVGCEHGECAVQAVTDWSMPGLTLYRRCALVQDDGSCDIVGVDAHGTIVDGSTLFLRLGARPPDELAARAQDLLVGHAGLAPITPSTDHATWGTFVSADEWGLIAAPRVDAGTLTYFAVIGEMHPVAQRIEVVLATGAVTRTHVADLIPARDPAIR